MRRAVWFFGFGAFLLALRMDFAAAEERRVGLVIGNQGYSSAQSLKTPVEDARLIAKTLRTVGFADVSERFDLDRAAMGAALVAFEQRAADADWAVVYFAGYVADIGGVAYLAPVDAKASFTTETMVALDQLVKRIERARKLSLIILDASYDFPAGAAKGGLPSIELDGPTVVASAAKHGTLVRPSDARNSRYATALADGMLAPRVDIRVMFGRVRTAVRNATNNQQEPYTYGSPGGDLYYFRPQAP